MGRHGGGSRSGGSGRSGGSRSSGGSRGGGSGRTSKKPFSGCYNRSYYDRSGRLHTCYTSNKDYGTTSGWNFVKIFALVFITLHMLIMVCGFMSSMINIGGKVSGNPKRIYIQDRADLMTDAEEQEVLKLLEEVYDKSGMPVAVYTETFEWKMHYSSLEVYSEELYYAYGHDETAMVIVFSAQDKDGFLDWEYDMYCGDDTTKCMSDDTFDKLLKNFHKGMAGQNLADALQYAWNSVMDDLAKTTINWPMAPIILFLLCFYGLFYWGILGGTKKQNDAYRYFKQNPDKLSNVTMTLYSECPGCGAPNTAQSEVCPYCGGLLKISDAKVKYVKNVN
ncbi:MAG: TPM domain-containing protein [Lachnospira sp.]